MGSESFDRAAILFCFCGPVASGKSTISRRVVSMIEDLELSISSTTRLPRPNEEDGIHYHFLAKDEFQRRVQQGGFIEHAEFNTNLYGTERRVVDEALAANMDLLLDIDMQGVEQLKVLYPDNVVTVFVLPPSREVLLSRLRSRGSSESQQEIDRRMAIAVNEIEKLLSPGFSDYLLVNDDLDTAVADAASIVLSERNRLGRRNPKQVLDQFN